MWKADYQQLEVDVSNISLRRIGDTTIQDRYFLGGFSGIARSGGVQASGAFALVECGK